MAPSKQFILLPSEGLFAQSGAAFDMLVNLPRPASVETPETIQLAIAGDSEVIVLESFAENGAKLVEMSVDAARKCTSDGDTA